MCREEGEPHRPSWQSLALTELRAQFQTSMPAMLGMLINKIPWWLSLHFAGNIGNQELAAVALATTLCNVTGMSLSVGLSSAMSTLTGQARGKAKQHGDLLLRKEEELVLIAEDRDRADHVAVDDGIFRTELHEDKSIAALIYLYRGIFIQLLFVVPVGVWWISGIQNTLLALGQGDELAIMTESYLRILAPGLWATSINWTFTAWLQALEMADVPAYAAALAAIVHIPFNAIFIHFFGWGYVGVGAATVATQVVQLTYSIGYIFLTSVGKRRVLERTMASAIGRTQLSFWNEAKVAVNSMSGILQYLALALPGIVIISEWWASETCIFLAGTLIPHPDLALDGMTIYQSINTACFMLPVGCSIAGASRVGYFLGSGDALGADVAAKVSVASAALLSICLGSLLFFTPHTLFPSFFTPTESVVAEASRLIPLLSIYVVGDGIQSALNGVINGCGRQCIIMPIVIFAYWVVGVPLAYYFVFLRNGGIMCEDNVTCGVTGLVLGLTIGTWSHMLLLAMVVACTTNWTLETRKAKDRLELDDESKAIELSEGTFGDK
jgi:MATE family multidrug resistance protein